MVMGHGQAVVRPALVDESAARAYLGGISRNLLYKLISKGVVRQVHLGRAARYSLENLDEAIRRLQDEAR